MKLQASEIRIGNLFKYKGNLIKFAIEDFTEADNNSDFMDMLKPIEITEEWLEKMGFRKDEDYGVWHIDLENRWSILGLETSDYSASIVEKLSSYEESDYPCFSGEITKYVHQLQNIYHNLTGNELTIKE